MSRAFTKENDGWSYCTEKLDTCLYADENGKCIMESCVMQKPTPAQNTGNQTPGGKPQK